LAVGVEGGDEGGGDFGILLGCVSDTSTFQISMSFVCAYSFPG
jgi:hypothetical protein